MDKKRALEMMEGVLEINSECTKHKKCKECCFSFIDCHGTYVCAVSDIQIPPDLKFSIDKWKEQNNE